MLRGQRPLAPYPWGKLYGIPRGTMGQALSISALARSNGVTSKTLRYWERVGLLTKAARTHTGYRIFGADANHYMILNATLRNKQEQCVSKVAT